MTDWMNSLGHRANILNSNAAHIGVGYNPDGGPYGNSWAQLFMNRNCWIMDVVPSQDKAVCPQGGKLEELEVYLTEERSVHGTSHLPLTSGMCQDFDSSALGTQTVTIYGNHQRTAQIEIEVVEREPEPEEPTPTPTPTSSPEPPI